MFLLDQCSPLGGLNSYGQLIHRSDTQRYAESSVIVVASRVRTSFLLSVFEKKPSLLVLPCFKVCFQVDANSYFYDFSPLGTQAYASGVLAMLEVINLLKPHADALGNTSVVFIAFDGVRIVCHLNAFDCLLGCYCDILNLSSVHRSSTITPDLCAWCMRCHRASFLQIPSKWEDTWLHWTWVISKLTLSYPNYPMQPTPRSSLSVLRKHLRLFFLSFFKYGYVQWFLRWNQDVDQMEKLHVQIFCSPNCGKFCVEWQLNSSFYEAVSWLKVCGFFQRDQKTCFS